MLMRVPARLTAAVALVSGALAGPAANAAVAAPAPAPGPAAPACFGGPAHAIARGEKAAGQVMQAGDALYWIAGGDLRRMPLAGKVASTVAKTRGVDIKIVDERVAVGGTGLNNLEAIDLGSGRSRVLVEGHTTMEQPVLFSSLALDATYLYFGRGEYDPRFTRSPRIGFHRVRRAGASAPEFLGVEPDGQTAFVVADGYVYWRSARKRYKPELVRRRLQKDAPTQLLVPLQSGGDALTVHGGRVYYVDGEDIRSVPVDGRAAPITHVAIGIQQVIDLVADGSCVYWLNHAGMIQRARGEGGVAEQIATLPSDPATVPTPRHELAIDGNHLYWADPASGSIMASPRAADAAAPVRTIAAKPTAGQPPRPMGVSRLLVGSGWGCARLTRGGDAHLHCWQTPAADSKQGEPAIRARPVPWLSADHLAAAADRLCALAGDQTRCWRPAELFGPAPRDMPVTIARARTIWDAELAVGARSSCSLKDGLWTCAGDDSYGQLGRGTAASPGGRLTGTSIALGAFHGCVSDDSSTRCWGRNDTMQLGLSTTETCAVGGRDVPCSRAAKPPSFPVPKQPGIYAADTFTCMQRADVHCWGASRDGLFGTADVCPAGLRDAWPTTTGALAAPKATCSATPVELPAFPHGRDRTPYAFAIGPRGACAVVGGEVKCAGAIPTPPGLRIDWAGTPGSSPIAVSPGDDPSACAVDKGAVICWGAGYSAAATPERPARVVFTDTPAGGPAVDGVLAKPDAKWPQGCRIHTSCEQRSLPVCAAGSVAAAVPWSKLAGRDASSGTRVAVTGPLLVQATVDSAPELGCRVPLGPLPIVIGEGKASLVLDGLACAGDESRRCCAAPALGQKVMATGELAAAGARFILRNPQLCALR